MAKADILVPRDRVGAILSEIRTAFDEAEAAQQLARVNHRLSEFYKKARRDGATDDLEVMARALWNATGDASNKVGDVCTLLEELLDRDEGSAA